MPPFGCVYVICIYMYILAMSLVYLWCNVKNGVLTIDRKSTKLCSIGINFHGNGGGGNFGVSRHVRLASLYFSQFPS